MKLLETDQELLNLMKGILESRLTDNAFLQKTLCLRLRREANRKASRFAACFAECYLAEHYAVALDKKNCFRQLSRALSICRTTEYTELLLFIYNVYGIAYASNGEPGMATESFLAGITEAERCRNYEYLARFYCNIGDVFLRLKKYDDAQRYTKKALATYRKCKKSERIDSIEYVIISNLADSMLGMAQPKKALELVDGYIARNAASAADPTLRAQRGFALAMLGRWSDAVGEFLIYERDKNVPSDKEQYAELLIRIAHLAIAAGDVSHVRVCRELIGRYVPKDNSLVHMHMTELDIATYSAFGPEELLGRAYSEYYCISREMERTAEKESAHSVKDRIKLYLAVRENTEIMQHNRQLKDISGMDELSGLPNRRALNERLNRAVENSGGVSPVGVVVFDIDRFKSFNDTHGHLVGDKVLSLTAFCLRDSDLRFFPCRFGGDEFITVCESCSDGDITSYIERCFERVREHQVETAEGLSRITLSAGYFNESVPQGTEVDNLIMRADQALYEAKCRSRDCYVAYRDLYGRS